MSSGLSRVIGLWLPHGNDPARIGRLLEWAKREGLGLAAETPELLLLGRGQDRWSGANMVRTDDRLLLLLGEPICEHLGAIQPRAKLLPSWLNGEMGSRLAQCHGTFAGARWQPGCLELFGDKLGVRGLFHAPVARGRLFATDKGLVIRALHALGEFPEPDHQGIAESIAFGVSLSDRTSFKSVKRLREAEHLRCTADDIQAVSYFRWSDSADSRVGIEAATELVDQAMLQAVSDRIALLPSGATHCGFLSGGMDSRYVMACLLRLGVDTPVSVNVAPEGSQDAGLGNMAAAALGTRHRYMPTPNSLPGGMDEAVRRIGLELGCGRSPLWWSGDGGSVGLGHVYLTEASTVQAQTATESLARQLTMDNNWRLTPAALKRDWRWLCDLPLQGAVAELQRLMHFSIERRAFAFVLLNDQRRHLDRHFATLDGREHDLLLPFFDARFVSAVLSVPVELLLRHRLYNQIFATRLPATFACAWQSYPGHIPCPHPIPPNLRSQWEGWHDAGVARHTRHALARRLLGRGAGGRLAAAINRSRLLLLAAMTAAGMRDLSYALNEAEKLCVAFDESLPNTISQAM